MDHGLIRTRWWVVLFAALLVSAPAISRASPEGEAKDQLDELLSMLEGEYRTAEPDQRARDEPLLCDRRVRVEAPLIGEHVIYMQINKGEDEALYRQILMVFDTTSDGGISQTSWRFNEPASFVDQFDGKEAFAALSKDDLQPALPNGCGQTWRKKDSGWYGYTNPDTCRIWSKRRQMFRRIESETLVASDGLLRSERGFDDEGIQIFGTEPGKYYRLKRLPDH